MFGVNQWNHNQEPMHLKTIAQLISEAMSPHDMKDGSFEREMWMIGGRAYNITDPKELAKLIKNVEHDLYVINRVEAGKMNKRTASAKRKIPKADEKYLRETLDKLKKYKPQTSEAMSEDEVRKWHDRKMRNKKLDQEKRNQEHAELDAIELSDDQISDILAQIKAKKYNMLENMEIARKLQKMGLLRAPTTIEKNSSFGQLYYITAKGEKFLKEGAK